MAGAFAVGAYKSFSSSCLGALEWQRGLSLSLFCATFDKVAFALDASDNGVRGESRIVCHLVDLRLHVFEVTTKGVNESEGFKFGPVNVTHV